MNMAPYDVKLLWKSLVVIISIIGICKVTDGSGILVAVPFLLVAMKRRKAESVFFWMFFLLTSVCINSFFLPQRNGLRYCPTRSSGATGIERAYWACRTA